MQSSSPTSLPILPLPPLTLAPLMPRHRRGYSLPLVLVVLGMLATAMTLVVVGLASSAKTTGSMIGRRQTLHACDGIIRALMVKSRDYFATTAIPTAPGLRDFLCDPATAPGCPPAAGWFPEMVIEEVKAETGGVDVVEEVPTGSFRGQMARRTDIALTVVARKTATQQRCRIRQSAINSEIGLFQFVVFSAMPIELFDPPLMDIHGRIHVNGDFDAGNGPLTIEKITAAGVIRANGTGFEIRDAGTGTPVAITSSNDGTRSNWRVTSENTWHGNAQDVSWGVPFLRLPVTTTAPVQAGRNASNSVKSNSGMLRLLVDPPRPADDAATRAERFATKAAIRIINGIWYKNDGVAPWPGVPIWSDHPHPYTGANDSEEAGLVDSTILQAAPPSSAGPVRYSYYETINNGAGDPILTNDAAKPSVVSYGSLIGGGGSWAPGHNNAVNALVVTGNDPEKLVDGTKSGFVDGRVQKDVKSGSANTNVSKGRILPMNFDVGAFVEALKDTTIGELGSHFPTGLGDDAIVWIANTWPNHGSGFPDGAAGKPPAMAGTELATLPLPLCGSEVTPKAFAGTTLTVPCKTTGLTAPTAVRVYNAASIDPAVLPRGLSIVTNGPAYLLGDANTASLTAAVPGTPRAEDPAGNWVPLLVGGDAVTLLSNKWNDAPRRWSSLIADQYGGVCSADAVETVYVFAMLSGHVERTGVATSGGINNLPRFLECWSGVKAIIHGSLVAGYRSVYQDHGFSVGPGPYHPPQRLWDFDPNLAKPANQPPGTPSFFVSAIERWQRD